MHSSEIELSNGHIWAVSSGFPGLKHPAVIIPTNGIEGMSDSEIGKAVKALMREARRCDANERADSIKHYGYDVEEWDSRLEHLLKSKLLLAEFADESEEIRQALNLIAEVEQHNIRKTGRKQK